MVFGFEGGCCDSTAVVGKPCEVQGSDESAAVGRTLLFKCSKTLDIGKTPWIYN